MNTGYLPSAPCRQLAALALSLVIALTSGCSLIGDAIKDRAGSALGVGKTTTASGLWADVPQVEGSTKVEAELGLPFRLMFRTMLSQANSESGGVDDLEAVIYKTDKSITDVTGFYTRERMQAQGWDLADAPGCDLGSLAAGDGSDKAAKELTTLTGNFCMFGRQGATAGDKTMLMIIVAPGDKESENSIIYARIDLAEKK